MACQVGEVGMVIFLHTVQFPEYMLARCGYYGHVSGINVVMDEIPSLSANGFPLQC